MSEPSIHLVNLGCSKNQVDSESILTELQEAGCYLEPNNPQADYVLINTCGFIDVAKEESIQEILTFVSQKKEQQKLIVAGCLSQRYKKDLQKAIPEVDHFIGTYSAGKIVELIQGKKAAKSCLNADKRVFLENFSHHAYLKIAEGCDRICGFCAIPGMRGKQRSFSISKIVKDAQILQSQGVLEVSLIAQDLTYYGREKGKNNTLSELLRALLENTDIPWFRLMYAYPAFIDDKLLKIMKETRVCSYLDMPIQHASSSVLQSMRRGYNAKQLKSLMQKIQSFVPDISLRTTMLIGYPGETEDDFKELMNFVEDVRFHRLGAFAYSDEDGTFAADELKNPKVDEDVIRERLDKLMNLQQDISLDYNQKKINSIQTVIIDEQVKNENYQYLGRTQADAYGVDNSVCIQGEGAVVGSFQKVKIDQAHEFDLEGCLFQL